MNKLLMSGVAALTVCLALPAMAEDDAAGKSGPKGPRPEMKDKMFEKLDADNSGGISLKEMQDEALARVQERFTDMDTNKDGQVSKDELKPPRRDHKGPKGDRPHKGRKGGPDADGTPAEDAPDA